MFVDELRNYHHKIGEIEEQWITENVENLNDTLKLNFSRELRNYKEITVFALKKVFEEVTGKKAKTYYWSVCLECGCEYNYELPMCPDCYDRGFECRTKSVKTSEFKPPVKVINYNKKYLNGDKNEVTCYNCVHKKESYCTNFGNYKWQCKKEEYEICDCKLCCSLAKKANREIEEARKVQKASYAVPLKKG